MSNNNSNWELIHMSNRRLQAQSRRLLRRRVTAPEQQASNLQLYYRLLVMGGAHRPSIMVPVPRRGNASRHLNNTNRFLTTVTLRGGRFPGLGGSSHQAGHRLPPQFVAALAIRRVLRRMSPSQNDRAAMSIYGRLRAADLPPPPRPAQNRPAPPVNNTVVDNERVRSQEPVPSEESATVESENPTQNDVVESEQLADLTLKL